jgi:two-component system nitrogen regulation sensor histidine kinase GlnL
VRAEFGVDIVRDYDPSLPELSGDREQLIQAVLNIARNAAQAGARRVTFRTRAMRNITLRKQRTRLALDLQVIDDGPGVPEEIQDRVFNPLVSGREGGTGLGLSLAQTFVHYHQGVIEFESRPGRTTFRIVLPLR